MCENLTVGVASMRQKRDPNKYGTPSDGSERVVRGCVNWVVYVIDLAHTGWSEEGTDEHHY